MNEMNVTTAPKAPEKEQIKALETVKEFESGKYALDTAKYREAISILKDSDIKSPYLTFPPRFTDRIAEAFRIARLFYREKYGSPQSTKLIAEMLKLNRKLSHYAEGEMWTEEMHIAAIFNFSRPHRVLSRKFFQDNLNPAIFGPGTAKAVADIIFDAPNSAKINFKEGDNEFKWKINVMEFLEDMAEAPIPSVLIFCASEIDVLYDIKRALKANNPKIWEISALSKKDQLWYYGKIVEIIGREPADQNIEKMMEEYRNILLKIYKFVEKENESLAK